MKIEINKEQFRKELKSLWASGYYNHPKICRCYYCRKNKDDKRIKVKGIMELLEKYEVSS